MMYTYTVTTVPKNVGQLEVTFTSEYGDIEEFYYHLVAIVGLEVINVDSNSISSVYYYQPGESPLDHLKEKLEEEINSAFEDFMNQFIENDYEE